MIIAMDRRTVDSFGRMRVDKSNISKAAVNPYYGYEIPNSDALDLDPQRIYYLLRDPEEMAKAADTFNLLPLLSKHVPVTAAKPAKELVIGSTGTDAVFDEPYLQNSLVVTDADAILGINLKTQHELSSAYAYDADMTPGEYGGVKYDGVMRNIRGNHVALVFEGRAGPDVVVGDSKLLEKPKMKLSTKATMLLCALSGFSAGVIAQDAQIGDLRAVVGGVKDLKTAKERKSVITAYTKLVTPHLREGMALDGLDDLVGAVADEDTPPSPGAMDAEDFPAQLAALLAGKVSPEVLTQIQAMCAGGAMDEEPKPKDEDDKVDKTAMDAAITAAVAANSAKLLAVRNAEIEVHPVIGQLAVAMDSADAVYKMALDHMKVDLTDVDPSAYRSVFRAIKAVPAPTPRVTIAQDSVASGVKTFAEMFPNATKVKGS